MAAVTAKSREQKKAEASVDSFRQDLGPFVVAAETTRMPMVFTNEEPGHPVIFANDAFLALTGYERQEVLAKSFRSLLAVGCDEKTMEIVEAAFRGDCVSEPEIHYKRKDGSEYWASLFVSPVCDQEGTVVQQFDLRVNTYEPNGIRHHSSWRRVISTASTPCDTHAATCESPRCSRTPGGRCASASPFRRTPSASRTSRSAWHGSSTES